MSFPNIPPGTWFEVPNSRIDSVLPSPLPPGGTGPSAIVTGWSGGCYDSSRDELFVTGGGHGDYAGNEHYRFSFNSMQWTRSWGPTPNAEIPPVTQAGKPEYLNGDPASRHTYSGVQYMPNIQRVFMCGGSLWGGSGGMGQDVWLLTRGGPFERKADITWSGAQVPYAAYDPTSGHVFMHRYNRFAEWDHTSDTWTRIGEWGAGGSPKATSVIDPKARKFYLIGNGNVWAYNLAGTPTTNKIQVLATTGPKVIVDANYPGVEYDPPSGKIYGWSGGEIVYAFDTSTLIWSALPLAPTAARARRVIPTDPPASWEFAQREYMQETNSWRINKIDDRALRTTQPPSQGTHGRWRHISAHDVYVIVNAINQNVFLYKPNRGTSGVTIQVANSVRLEAL